MLSSKVPMFLVLVLLVAVGGCKKPEEKRAPDAQLKSPGASPAAETNVGVVPGPPKISLLEAGAEPRSKLRLKPASNLEQTLGMVLKMRMSFAVNGQETPEQALPTSEMDMLVKVNEVQENGDIGWEFEYTRVEIKDGPDVDPSVVTATRAAVRGIEGIKGAATITDRGFLKQGDLTATKELSQQMQQMLDGMRQSLAQLTAPLPEEAVGVGAKWRVEQTIAQNGLVIQQTVLYTLEGVEDNVAQTAFELVQTAEPQTLTGGQIPPGVEAQLLSLESKGNGKTQIDMNSVMPKNGEVNMEMKMATKVTAGEQVQNMQMGMKMSVAIAPK